MHMVDAVQKIPISVQEISLARPAMSCEPGIIWMIRDNNGLHTDSEAQGADQDDHDWQEGQGQHQHGRNHRKLSGKSRPTRAYWGGEYEFVGADEVGVGEADSHGSLRRHPAVEGVHADALTVRNVDHLDRIHLISTNLDFRSA